MDKKKKSLPDPNSPLAQLALLPKVAIGLGGYDLSLSYSYRYALDIAFKVLLELNENERSQVLKGIFEVFEEWKNERGIYPPYTGGFFDFGSNSKDQLPAKEYIRRQALGAALRGEKQKYIAPWECDPFAQNPVRLFFKLFSEDYPPLSNYMKNEKLARYDYLLATVIGMTDGEKSSLKSSDCIEGALKLAQFRMDFQKSLIEDLRPYARQNIKMKRQARLQRKASKEETERKVLDLHHTFLSEGNIPPYKEYANRLGCSEATISRILKNNGYAKYKS